jgi:hypothetical protein
VLWRVEDNVLRRSTIQAFGLYPDGIRGNCSKLVRPVPGGIVDEMQNHSFQAITEELIVRVDEADSLHLNMPRRAITRWTPRAYLRALLANVPDPSNLLRCSIPPAGAGF